jgi:hypothetical protein
LNKAKFWNGGKGRPTKRLLDSKKGSEQDLSRRIDGKRGLSHLGHFHGVADSRIGSFGVEFA